MPTKAKEIENPVVVCSTCGTRLLKSGYCPKCHRKKDGTTVTGHGKHHAKPAASSDDDAKPAAPITVADYSRPPALSEDEYLCEGCRSPVHYLQRKCKKCGIYLDWRGSPAESDPDAVICPVCGAFCGYAEDEPGICPHCRYQG